MEKMVIDSWAWMEYIKGTAPGKKVRQIIDGNANVFSSVLSVAEVCSKMTRFGYDARIGRQIIAANSSIIPLDENQAYEAGQIHAEMRKNNANFGLADAVIISTARRLNAKILTGDPDFKDVKEAILI